MQGDRVKKAIDFGYQFVPFDVRSFLEIAGHLGLCGWMTGKFLAAPMPPGARSGKCTVSYRSVPHHNPNDGCGVA
jgi:hypothetical protein